MTVKYSNRADLTRGPGVVPSQMTLSEFWWYVQATSLKSSEHARRTLVD